MDRISPFNAENQTETPRYGGIHRYFSRRDHRRSWYGSPPFFLTFCLQVYFQSNFFISLLFHLFFLILTCSCQYSYNLMLTTICMFRPYIDTNNQQGMQLRRFKNRTLARLEFIYCTLFPLSHSN